MSLEDDIAQTITKFLPQRIGRDGNELPESASTRPRVARNITAAILALPVLRRAIARDTAIEELREKNADDAPIWMDADRASAWADGFNSARDRLRATGTEGRTNA